MPAFAAKAALLVFLTLFSSPVFSGKTPAREPGDRNRVLSIERSLRITDREGQFYFKSPRLIRVAPDGRIFVADEDQLLEFDGGGRFLRNLYRKGEGPGELHQIQDFGFRGDHIVICQNYPNKIVVLDRSGGLVADYRPDQPATHLLAILPDFLVMAHSSFRQDKQASEGLVDVTWKTLAVYPGGRTEDLGVSFATLWYGKKIQSAFIANHVTDLLSTGLEPPLLAVCHTAEYEIKLFDPVGKRIVGNFRWDYDRIKAGTKGGMVKTERGSTLSVPRDFHNDILRLFSRRGRIWALTSTRDEEKGWRVDVLDAEGHELDRFYLPLHKDKTREDLMRQPITVTDDAVLTVETNADELPEVMVYRILE